MTDITSPQGAAPERTAPKGAFWKFWGTTLWGIAILAVFMVAGGVAVFACLVWLDPGAGLPDDEPLRLLYSNGVTLFAIASTAFFGAFAVMALAVRLSGVGMRDYLGLHAPRGRDVAVGLAGLVVIYGVFVLLNVLTGPIGSPSFVVMIYRSAAAAGMVPALALAAVVLAPVGEEMLIRGFMLPGWAASRLGPTGAVLLTTAFWTALHTQYSWIVLTQIACIGLLLGWLRQRSGSTLLTIFLHAAQNGTALIQVAILDSLGS